MICSRCGREIPDGTVCPCSAQPTPTQPTPMQPTPMQPTPIQPTPIQPMPMQPAPMSPTSALSSNPALHVLKSIGSSPLFLTAAILYSVSVVLTLVSGIWGSADATAALYQFAYQFDVDLSPLYPYLDDAASTSVVSVLCSSLFNILTAVAYWIHFCTCRSRKSGNISTVGLTIWKVITYIAFISICVGAGVLFIAILILFGAGGVAAISGESASAGGAVIAIAVIVLLICGAIFGLAIPYFVCEIKVINRAKAIAATGLPDSRVSQFFVVMLWITAIFGLFGAVSTLFTDPVNGLALVASNAGGILIALCLTRYRREMDLVHQGMMPPQYDYWPAGQ